MPSVEYQALYRKYRPQTFDDVIGQNHVTSTLAREVAEGHVAHAYLFAGPRGTGKTTTARILAKALNCQDRRPDGSPDNTCDSCVAVTEGTSLDVMEMDAASHNSVDDIREMRVSVTTVASTSGAKRVFILDEAHMLSKAAGNALLKTLEEPPEGVHFVLATTEPYKLLDTIRSRSQRFDFHAISIEQLAAHLSRVSDAEGYKADAAALVAVARHAMGSARDSLSLLEQVAALGNDVVDVSGVSRALGLADADAYATLATAIGEQDARAGLELVARLASEGADLRRFVAEAVGFFRGAFLAHYAPNLAEIADESDEVLGQWRKTASRLSQTEVLRAVDLLGEALTKLREGREERLMLELAVIKLTRPETAADPEAIMARMDRLERRVGSASGPAPRPAPRSTEPSEGHEPSLPPSLPAAPADPPAIQPVEPVADTAGEAVGDPAATPPVATVGAAAAEPADAAAAPPTGVTMDQFRQIWPSLFGGLRDLLGARRWALFRETEPHGVTGDTLLVGVRHDFHLKALRDDGAVASVVATAAGDLLGFPVDVGFLPMDGPAAAADGGAEPATELDDLASEDPTAGSDPTDPFTLVAEELGGEVVEEFEVE
jgi:DNA polymerase III subunit gamma/tau